MATWAREVLERLQQESIAKNTANTEPHEDRPIMPTNYPGLQIPEQININKLPVNTTIEQFIETDIHIPEESYPDIFSNLGYIPKNQKAREDFSDDELKDQPAITLAALTDEAICQVGNYVFTQLSSTTSRSTTAGILLLAFQLKKQGNSKMGRVFSENIPESFYTLEDVDYDALDRTKIVDLGASSAVVEVGDEFIRAQAYAFISASMLRLFTRPPENYIRGWSHICNGFTTCYNKSFPILNFTPNIEVMKVVHKQFSLDDLLKSTLFRILYLSNDSDQEESLKRFLYEIHLSHTGMHILPITIRLCDALNCQIKTLLVYLWNGEYDRQITCLAKLLSWIIKPPLGKEKAMGRYGRIFTRHFMPALQTKSCPKLVYIFAAALKQERPEEHSGILEIAQLQDISASDKRKCDAAGRFLVKLVRKHVNKNRHGKEYVKEDDY